MLSIVELGDKNAVIGVEPESKVIRNLVRCGAAGKPSNRFQSSVADVWIAIQVLDETLPGLGVVAALLVEVPCHHIPRATIWSRLLLPLPISLAGRE